MGEPLIACDVNQLRRIERSIAELECRSAAEQLRRRSMLEALRAERRKLLGREISVSQEERDDRPTVSLEMALALGILR
jgi:hypothetical protein